MITSIQAFEYDLSHNGYEETRMELDRMYKQMVARDWSHEAMIRQFNRTAEQLRQQGRAQAAIVTDNVRREFEQAIAGTYTLKDRRPSKAACAHTDTDNNGICYDCGAYVRSADAGRWI